jgi:DNA-binding transcriptional LysR family regulator
MRKLTLEWLEILDAIDRRGSFSAAGEALHKVPSTISYMVAKMEEDLKVSLFQRNGPRIEITHAGEELLREGRLLLMAADSLEHRVKRVASGWESELRITVDSLISTGALAPLIADFCKVADATTLRLAEETLTGTWEALLDARADIVIAAGQGPAGGGYRAKEVAQLDFWFCVAPFHPLAKVRRPLLESEIRAHRAIVAADSARRMSLRSAGILSGQSQIVVPDMRAKLRLQAEGLGVGYLPAVFAKPAVEAGILVLLEVENPRPPESLSVAWRTNEHGEARTWWVNRLTTTLLWGPFIESLERLNSTTYSSSAKKRSSQK